MSSFRNATKRVAKKERSTPRKRQHLGLLERKKDYKVRAIRHHQHQKRLRALEEKAELRNKDEFYHSMVNSKTQGGVHKAVRKGVTYSHDEIMLLKTQDIGYLVTILQSEKKRVERLKAVLQLSEERLAELDEEDRERRRQWREENSDYSSDDVVEEEAGDGHGSSSEEEEEWDFDAAQRQPENGASPAIEYDDDDDDDDDTVARRMRKRKHTVFVEEERDVKRFRPADYFETPEELVGTRYNRLRRSQLESAPIIVAGPGISDVPRASGDGEKGGATVDMAQCEDDVLANLGFEEVTGISLETATKEAQVCEDGEERIVMPRLSQQQEEFIASLSEKRRKQYEKLRQRLARVAAIERSIAELRLKKKLMSTSGQRVRKVRTKDGRTMFKWNSERKR